MGTPAITRIYDEENNLLLAFIRMSDGGPDWHGEDLLAFCADYKIVNGIKDSYLDLPKIANGMGDFAAQCIAHFKDRFPLGEIYVISPKTMDEWHADYIYSVIFFEGQLMVETRPNKEITT